MKQILLTLNEKENFIIEDLDDFHVVIKADEEYRVRRELEAEVRPIYICGPCGDADTIHSSRRTLTAWSSRCSYAFPSDESVMYVSPVYALTS